MLYEELQYFFPSCYLKNRINKTKNNKTKEGSLSQWAIKLKANGKIFLWKRSECFAYSIHTFFS